MKNILDVGNCDPDHFALTSFFKKHFDCQVHRAHQGSDAMEQLRAGEFHLVLVNRKLDIDYSDGIEIIKEIKADQATSGVAVMLITNYADHQDAAVEVGALRGFGKLEYNDPATLERVQAALGV